MAPVHFPVVAAVVEGPPGRGSRVAFVAGMPGHGECLSGVAESFTIDSEEKGFTPKPVRQLTFTGAIVNGAVAVVGPFTIETDTYVIGMMNSSDIGEIIACASDLHANYQAGDPF